jgi:beta-lactam-binding protein with PASTA domain
MALVLVVVAMISALTAMRIAIHGREVEVPKLLGLSKSQAERQAYQQGLRVEVEDRFYSAEVPEGRIMSQSPLPGTKVRRGWRVRLAESLGPQSIVVPDVMGQSGRAAELNLRRRGLEVPTVAVARLPGEPPDQVIAQSPPPNAAGVASNRVSLLVSAPEEPEAYVMPSFVGRPLAEAEKALEAAGLTLGAVRSVAPSVSAGQTAPRPNTVVKQNPVAGDKVTAASAVDLDVSR